MDSMSYSNFSNCVYSRHGNFFFASWSKKSHGNCHRQSTNYLRKSIPCAHGFLLTVQRHSNRKELISTLKVHLLINFISLENLYITGATTTRLRQSLDSLFIVPGYYLSILFIRTSTSSRFRLLYSF